MVRRAYATAHPEVLDAFLQAQLDATDFLNHKPLEAAAHRRPGQRAAAGSGVPLQRPGGTSFDTTLKPSLVDALKSDVPYLKSIGDFADLDVGGFVQDAPLRARVRRPRAATTTRRGLRRQPVRSAGTPPGSELWLDGSDTTQPIANPTSLLQAVRDATARGAKVRAAYVPDAELGTRWFADKAVWVHDGANYLPFGHRRRRASLPRRPPRRHRRSTTNRHLAGAV